MKRLHKDRRGLFERLLRELAYIHLTIQPRCPWQNGIIERSNRTDNEELFSQMRFESSEHRRYMLKLWEFEYNNTRPHQGIACATPMQVYRELYAIHAHGRMLM